MSAGSHTGRVPARDPAGAAAPPLPGLESLSSAIAEQGGELAAALAPARAGAAFGPLAAAGSRARATRAEHELLVESIFEGYLLHYSEPRILDPPDPDLRLLAGDFLYAFGLSRLARLGDLDAVAELADLITLCAQVHAGGHASAQDPARSLPAALWSPAALAVGSGCWEGYERVKAAVRSEEPDIALHAHGESAARAAETGVADEATRALIAFQAAVPGQLANS